MKVLYISHYSDCYGANLALINLIVQLRKYGVEATVLLPKHGAVEEVLKQNEISYIVQEYYMCRAHVRSSVLRKVYTVMRNYWLYRRNIRKLDLKDIDLVHTNSSCTDYGDYISRVYKLPHVWHFREYGEKDYNLKDLYPVNSVSKKYKRAKYRIAISKAIKEHYEEKYHQNCTLIYDGIKSIDEEIVRKLHNGKVRFCVVGLITEKKNQVEVLKACSILREQGEKNFEVHFFGSGREEYMEALKKFVAEHHLEEHIFWEGYVENVTERLSAFDVGIIASVSEGFGLVTAEYMSAGLAVIGNRAGATPELIEETVNGSLYQTKENGEDLAGCMGKYIKHPEIISVQGTYGRKKVEENFTVEINAKKIYDIYQTLGIRNEK